MTKEKKNTKTSPKVGAVKNKSASAKPTSKAMVTKEPKPVKIVAKAAVTPVKKAVAKPTKEKKAFTGKTIQITQVGSGVGRIKPQIQTLKGLGLNKMHRTVELQDTPSIRGMINKVKHLIKVFNK